MIEFRYFTHPPYTNEDVEYEDGTLLGRIKDGDIISVNEDADDQPVTLNEEFDSFENFIDYLRSVEVNGVIDPVALMFSDLLGTVVPAVPTADGNYIFRDSSILYEKEIVTPLQNEDSQLGPVELHELSKYHRYKDSEDPEAPVYKEYETKKDYRTVRINVSNIQSSEWEYIATIDIQDGIIIKGSKRRLRLYIGSFKALCPTLNPVGLLLENSFSRLAQVENPDNPDDLYTDPRDVKKDPEDIIEDVLNKSSS